MMRVSYYPGCSLEATARDYRESLEYVCRELGIELAEVADWNCCGATAAHSIDHFCPWPCRPATWPWPKKPAGMWWSPAPCASTASRPPNRF